MRTAGQILGVVLLALFLSTCFAGAPVPLTPTPAPPAPGLWAATVAFGTVFFMIDTAGTGLTEVGFDLNWECGSQLLYGRTAFAPGGQPWPIRNRSFAVTIQVPGGRPLKTVFMEGTFDTTGRLASGTWRGVSPMDEPCELSWQASPAG